MKKTLVILAVLGILGLTIGVALPVYADSPNNGGQATSDNTTWQQMYQACANGDWNAMAEIHSGWGGGMMGGWNGPQNSPNTNTGNGYGWGGMMGNGSGMMGGWGGSNNSPNTNTSSGDGWATATGSTISQGWNGMMSGLRGLMGGGGGMMGWR